MITAARAGKSFRNRARLSAAPYPIPTARLLPPPPPPVRPAPPSPYAKPRVGGYPGEGGTGGKTPKRPLRRTKVKPYAPPEKKGWLSPSIMITAAPYPIPTARLLPLPDPFPHLSPPPAYTVRPAPPSPSPYAKPRVGGYPGEGGTGGKTPKRPLRRTKVKPYAPPEKKGWLSRLASGASHLISSVFSNTNAAQIHPTDQQLVSLLKDSDEDHGSNQQLDSMLGTGYTTPLEASENHQPDEQVVSVFHTGNAEPVKASENHQPDEQVVSVFHTGNAEPVKASENHQPDEQVVSVFHTGNAEPVKASEKLPDHQVVSLLDTRNALPLKASTENHQPFHEVDFDKAKQQKICDSKMVKQILPMRAESESVLARMVDPSMLDQTDTCENPERASVPGQENLIKFTGSAPAVKPIVHKRKRFVFEDVPGSFGPMRKIRRKLNYRSPSKDVQSTLDGSVLPTPPSCPEAISGGLTAPVENSSDLEKNPLHRLYLPDGVDNCSSDSDELRLRNRNSSPVPTAPVPLYERSSSKKELLIPPSSSEPKRETLQQFDLLSSANKDDSSDSNPPSLNGWNSSPAAPFSLSEKIAHEDECSFPVFPLQSIELKTDMLHHFDLPGNTIQDSRSISDATSLMSWNVPPAPTTSFRVSVISAPLHEKAPADPGFTFGSVGTRLSAPGFSQSTNKTVIFDSSSLEEWGDSPELEKSIRQAEALQNLKDSDLSEKYSPQACNVRFPLPQILTPQGEDIASDMLLDFEESCSPAPGLDMRMDEDNSSSLECDARMESCDSEEIVSCAYGSSSQESQSYGSAETDNSVTTSSSLESDARFCS